MEYFESLEKEGKNIIAGDHPIITDGVTIVQGVKLPALTILGKITTGANKGKYTKYNIDAIDGNQEPDCILKYDVDATSREENSIAFFHAELNKAMIVDIDENAIQSLRSKGIFLKEVLE